MAGKTYVGNSSNKSARPKKIYIGNSSNKAAAVKAVYVGNSSNKAVKVYPSQDIPDRYTQYLYLGMKLGQSRVTIDFPSPAVKDNPRIEITFRPKNALDADFFYKGADNDDWVEPVYYGWRYGFGIDWGYTHYGFNCFHFQYGRNGSNGYAAFNKDTYSSGEQVLSGAVYTVDFNHISNNVSYFYLYCSQGYYSMASHNLIGSIAKQTLSEATNPINLYLTDGADLYSYKVYNSSNSLLRDLYPCQDTSTNKFGFYDKQTSVFYSLGNVLSSQLDIGLL